MKDVELEGFRWLKEHLKKALPKARLLDTMNKGRRHHRKGDPIGDAILIGEDCRRTHIEIKASSGRGDSNIRFTHQTISKAIGQQLILAFITHLSDSARTKVIFCSVGNLQEEFTVEPHFILKSSQVKKHGTKLMATLIGAELQSLDLTRVLKLPVSAHMRAPEGDESGILQSKNEKILKRKRR